jgi:protein-S-isoprenylcysteine O-methyltransferase Ste14
VLRYFQNLKEILFFIDLIIHYVLLIGIVWSIAFPTRRIWPPPKKNSWQYYFTWILFYLIFILSGVLILLDWNSGALTASVRFLLGVPIILLGTSLVSWGIITLGVKNTSGLQDGFRTSGPYEFTRNPQYLGDMLLFLGIILISNSLYLLVTNTLLILIFAITPLAEEVWLEANYGEEYKKYKKLSTRFL